MVNEFAPYDLCPANPQEAEILHDKLDMFNAKQLSFEGNVEEFKSYVVKEQHFIKDKGSIVAGIKTCLYLKQCMFVNVLFVEEEYRGKGLGSRLLQYAEQKAKAEGIRLVHLDTFDFQAKDFYLKQGYEIFGVLDDCPIGHKRYYFKKILK